MLTSERLRPRFLGLALAGAVLMLAGCTGGAPLSGEGATTAAPAPAAAVPSLEGQYLEGQHLEGQPPPTFDPKVIHPLPESYEPVLPVTVGSADGVQVTITSVERVVAVNLSGSLAEIVFTLGLGDRLVGRDISATFTAAEQVPVVTQGHDLAAEPILNLNPTMVLADASIGPPEVLDQIRNAGISVVLVNEAWSLADIEPRISQVAAALGVPTAGEALITRTQQELAQAGETIGDAPPPRVAFLYVRGTVGVYLMAGKGSGADAMIEAAGGADAGTAIGIEKFRPITSEGLINAAPDVILVMEAGLESVGGIDGLLKIPGIAQTPAGENRRVVAMDDGALLSFGPRTGEMVTALAWAIAHP